MTFGALVCTFLQFVPEVIADMLVWVTRNGLEAFDVKPFLVGGDQARIVPDTRDKTMTRPPTTDTELEKVRSLAYNPAGGKQVDIWIPVCDGAKLPSCNKGTADEAGVLGAQPKLTPQCGIPKGLIP